jgi:UDP-N-acetyl-D-galactosamine dehydrogenase
MIRMIKIGDKKMTNSNTKVAIVGLGYVGLPLAIEFAKYYQVVGYDLSVDRIGNIKKGLDTTLEITRDALQVSLASGFSVTNVLEDIRGCTVFIVTVPTPIDEFKRPNLEPLISASNDIGSVLKVGDLVIYESTVYPGCTEEDCVPILERMSGLVFNKDFYCGYSPERINPGDKKNTVANIVKITSGSNEVAGERVDALYKRVIKAGTYLASSIKVAEAAKVIENAQRDINIAFVNELSLIFEKMGIDTKEVLSAASTKWNFLNFQPGLVGGHCIGVDPYYLCHKAQSLGYNPEIILAGRRLNDGMGDYVANQVIKKMIQKGQNISQSKVLVLGVAFKENCPDVRNSKVIDVIRQLEEFSVDVDCYDPWADASVVKSEYGINMLPLDTTLNMNDYQAVILAVAHNEFESFDFSLSPNRVIYDVKGVLKKSDGSL